MKSQYKSGVTLAAVCGLGLGLGVAAFRVQADEPWDQHTIMTIDQPVEIENTLLEPGSYMFKLANSDRHIVQVFTSDRKMLINTFLAIPNYRLQPTGDTRFMFWETPPGTARALRAWFYPGQNFGQEFRYPTLLADENPVVNTTPVASTPNPSSETQVAAVETQTQAQPQAEPAPAPAVEERHEEVIVAQNNPPAAQETQPEVQNAPSPETRQSEVLPKTASPYPLAGLIGMFSMALYGLLRLKRTA